jgi:hypothetical protein
MNSKLHGSASRSLAVAALTLCIAPATAQVEWRKAPILLNRVDTPMAYDVARGRVVLFGGNVDNQPTDETWEWDGSTWTLRAPATSPAPRIAHALAYDAVRSRVVLLGGMGVTYSAHDDTWEWDVTTWVQVTRAARPPARFDDALAGDSVRGRVLMFAGLKG